VPQERKESDVHAKYAAVAVRLQYANPYYPCQYTFRRALSLRPLGLLLGWMWQSLKRTGLGGESCVLTATGFRVQYRTVRML
jgi:hypothetical protein